MVSGSISLPSPGFFSPFPHGTPSLSVAALYSALDRGRPGFRQGSSCPALLRYRIMEGVRINVRGCHPLRRRCPAPSASFALLHSTGHPHAALQPRTSPVWAPPRSLAATCGISLDCFSRVTWMVHFTRYSPAALFHSRARCTPRGVRVTPFGSLRITGYVLLPAAFRSLSRPSSPCGSTGIRHGPTSRLTILPSPGDPSPGAFIICPFLPSSCQTSRPAPPCGPKLVFLH